MALQSPMRHPRVVRKLVVVSTTMKRDASYPEVLAIFDRVTADAPRIGEQIEQSPLATIYPEAEWATVFAKIGEMERQDYDWSEGVTSIASPAMLADADADADADSIRPEPMVEFYRLLGGGRRDAGLDGSGRAAARLALLPGRTHYDIFGFPGLAAMVTSFVDSPG